MERLKPRTCDACRHWDAMPNRAGGECLKEKITRKDDYNKPDFMAAIDPEDPYLLTGPKFGCVHWETKEAEPQSSSQ